MLAPSMVLGGVVHGEPEVPGSPNPEGITASLAWAVLLLHVSVLFSIVVTLEYLNVPVWEQLLRFLRAAG